jgi:Capsule assembly protein Wzi
MPYLRHMKRVNVVAPLLLAALPTATFSRGVSPYLPLNLEPEIESQIERVLILADKPVMTRPIAAATVLDALPKACKIDHALCDRVRRYLQRYTHTEGIAHASIEGAATGGGGGNTVEPNRYGMRENANWDASAQVYAQLGSYVLVDAGAVAYEGKTDFAGSIISLGFGYAQLDLGYRPHWFSPMSDSSMLMSTEAPTMPSVTLSNYEPISPFNLHYEIFGARMSKSSDIVLGDGTTTGNPRLTGFHLDVEPAGGWAIGVNRLYQFGGGAAGNGSWRKGVTSLFAPSAGRQTGIVSQQVGNQEASFTSSLLFPGRVPFSVYFEYAGEDTSRGKSYLLGNSSLSAGIHFPRLWRRFDLTLETSEWQNAWYVHSVYRDGLTNYGRVVGNWFGDQRVFNDGVGGRSGMIQLGYEPPFGGLFQLRYRVLENEQYTGQHYQTYHDAALAYSRPVHGVIVGGQLEAGRDVFGASFSRISGFIRYDEGGSLVNTILDGLDDEDHPVMDQGELFVDLGANSNRQNIDLTTADTRHNGPYSYGAHVAVGARRFVSDHSDLGARIEADDVQGHSLIGVRALDYRYRFRGPLALNVFIGAARYGLATPAYGIYYGAGVQYRNIIRGWDLGFDYRYADSVARDHLLPGDPANVGDRSDSFYNISLFTLAISRHF